MIFSPVPDPKTNSKSYKFEFSEIFINQNKFCTYCWFIFIAFFFKNNMVQTNSQKF